MKKNGLSSSEKKFQNKSLPIIEELNNKLNNSYKKRAHFERFKYLFSKFNTINRDFIKKTPLLTYSLKRIIYAFISLYLAIGTVYILIALSINDISIMNDFDFQKPTVRPYSPEWNAVVNNRKEALGLNGPILKQVLIYWRNITPFIPKQIQLPLSVSQVKVVWGEPQTKWFWLGLIMNKSNGIINYPVYDQFKTAMPISFTIGFSSIILSFALGIPLGIICAKNKEKSLDNSLSWLFLIMISAPATILISVFWLLSVQYLGNAGIWGVDDWTNFMAVIALSIITIPGIVIETRRYIIDEMTADYTKFAESKGLSSTYIFYVHIFRNAGVRIIRVIPGALILSLFGSSLLIERFWGAPGMSKYILTGVATNDIFIVLGFITLSAGVGVFSSLVSDLILVLMDPRVKLS
ncbi:oligopeptide ABC transporter permease [Spiroplasma corruscae]|uniref:Oligopeptide ABC transporter permease n=1 Tax=Spiroplasma corruscae TaxID=216934 RepID=A0A222ENW0_9MOLU|nr:oligopeptide ABC transporter permease OppB [Spiroplasma corruscae]ASP28190.1 oligopeptide ABC transporter permease [Spiroplasma corruscae]